MQPQPTTFFELPPRDVIYLLGLKIPPSQLGIFAAADPRQGRLLGDEQFCREYYNLRVPSDLQLTTNLPNLTFCQLIPRLDRVLQYMPQIQEAAMRWRLCSEQYEFYKCPTYTIRVGEGGPHTINIQSELGSGSTNGSTRDWPPRNISITHGFILGGWTVTGGDVRPALIEVVANGLAAFPPGGTDLYGEPVTASVLEATRESDIEIAYGPH